MERRPDPPTEPLLPAEPSTETFVLGRDALAEPPRKVQLGGLERGTAVGRYLNAAGLAAGRDGRDFRRRASAKLPHRPRQSEIHHPHPSILPQQHVVRLEIPMHQDLLSLGEKDKVALAEVEDWLAKRKDNKEKTPLG